MSDTVWIVGASMTRFGRWPGEDAVSLGATAAASAVDDAGLRWTDIGLLAAACALDVLPIGQRIQRSLVQSGIPVINVTNACASGATAVRVAHMAVGSGEADLAVAVGTEQMGKKGMLNFEQPRGDRFEPSGRYGAVRSTEGVIGTELMPGVFSMAGMEYALRHGLDVRHFAEIAVKNHRHSALNPLAQYRNELTLDAVETAAMISYPNTLPMCCPTGDGAAALVLASDAALARLDPDVRRRAVKVSASVLTSDPWSEVGDAVYDINGLTRDAAEAAYEQAGVGPGELDLVELHDCFATAELVHYDNLGLCEPGGAGDFLESGAPNRDGRLPVNVSGGLLSKGHPIAATGVAGIYEVVVHLRGEAGDRQIDEAKVGLAHVIGLGSACGVHVLERRAR
jgi:acetyl-CoA acetyltransferase